MGVNRSIERDYDINYHTRAASKAFDEALEHLRTLLKDVQYEPWATTCKLEEQWKTWKDELETSLY